MRPLFKRFSLKPVQRFLFKNLAKSMRWIYNNNSVDNRGVMPYKVFGVDGDIDIEFRTGPVVLWGNADRTVISQCLTATFGGSNGKEFTLYFNAANGLLQGLVGGTYTISAAGTELKPNTHYRWQLQGQRCRAWVNGVLTHDNSAVARGPSREPAAIPVVGAQTHGSANTFRAYFSGALYDLKVNGVFWPINDPKQTVQLPEPANLGATTGLNLVNNSSTGMMPPVVDAEGWSVMNLTGAQTYSYLGFNIPVQPGTTYLVETIADYVSSNIFYACDSNGASGASQLALHVNQPANSVVRHLITTPASLSKGFMLITRNAANGATGKFKAKLLRAVPLHRLSATELVTNGSFDSNMTGWFVTGTSGGQETANVVAGRAVLNCIANSSSRFERGVNLEVGEYYLASMDVIAINGIIGARVSIIRNADGNYNGVATSPLVTAGNKAFVMFRAPAATAILQVVGDSTNPGSLTVDNVSLRKLDSICNPITLVNATSPGWQEIQA